MTSLRQSWRSAVMAFFLSAGVLSGANYTQAENTSTITTTANKTEAKPANVDKTKDGDAADKHITYIVDTSRSMTMSPIDPLKSETAYESAMYALRNALLTSETLDFNLSKGNIRYAFSIFFYGENTYHAGTHTIQSRQDLYDFVNRYIWNSETDEPRTFITERNSKESATHRPLVNSNATQLARALTNVGAFLLTEVSHYYANSSVLVIGDYAQGLPREIKDATLALAREAGASISIIPVLPVMRIGSLWMESEKKARERQIRQRIKGWTERFSQMITPEGMTYIDPFKAEIPVPEGRLYMAPWSPESENGQTNPLQEQMSKAMQIEPRLDFY